MAEVTTRRDKIQDLLLAWGKKNHRTFPWRSGRTPYEVLVAEVVLRRTTTTAASRVFERLVDQYPDVYSLCRADRDDLERLLATVGYNKQRARILKEVASTIVNMYGGEVPDDKDALLRIPHVGPYTAGAVLSLGYNIRSEMVDSNVERIISRLFCRSLPEKSRHKAVVEVCRILVPQYDYTSFNLALLDLGALVCRYTRPRHEVCPLMDVCDFYHAGGHPC